jgi:hypothetical protein
VLLLYRARGRWPLELAAGVCMLFALVKPNVSAPFFWVFLLVPRRKWPALFVIMGYVLLTLVGSYFLPGSLVDQVRGFLSRGTAVAQLQGYGDIPLWLGSVGQQQWIMPATVGLLAAMGLWVWAVRRADRWLILASLALMTRLWAYHRLYDDMLNLMAFIALLRLARGVDSREQPDQVAWGVFLVALLTIAGPATPLEFWYGGLSQALRGWQTAVRVLMLAVIMHRAWVQRGQPPPGDFAHEGLAA